MVPKAEAAKVLNKFYSDPNSDELACYRNELQKKPHFIQTHLFYHAPGVVKRDESLPSHYPRFGKHPVNTNVPAKSGDNKNNPANAHK